jgi:threonine-phosphate decarboxylase
MKEHKKAIPFSLLENADTIYRLAKVLGIQSRKVLDFRSAINPLGVSHKVKAEIRKHLKYLPHFPDPDMLRLRKLLALHHDVNPELLLCGDGIGGILSLLLRTLNPRRVFIPRPTLHEYDSVLEQAQATGQKTVTQYYLLTEGNDFCITPDEFIRALSDRGRTHIDVQGAQPTRTDSGDSSSDMAILQNPGHLTGKKTAKDALAAIADAARAHNCILVLDESFVDFIPNDSWIRLANGNHHLIILRSMTHFYSLAGFAIGYGVFPGHILERMEKARGPWVMNSLAQRAAVAALKDKAYRKESSALLAQEKKFLEKSFRRMGLSFFDSDVNYYLVKADKAREISLQLRRRGVLVQEIDDNRKGEGSYMRIGVRTHRENTLFVKALAFILKPG